MRRTAFLTSQHRIFRAGASALAALAALAWSTGAWAANPLGLVTGGAAAAPASVAATSPEPIPAAEITSRADVDERFAQEVLQRARQKDPSALLGPRLEVLADGVAALNESFRRDALQQLPVVRLESIEGHWRFYERELAKWRRELERLSAPYSDDAASLAQRRAAWQATRDSLADSSIPTALRERADGILAQLSLAERTLSAPLEAQIRLGRRANLVEAGIETGRKAVDAAIDNHDRRLGRMDATPLWRVLQGGADAPGYNVRTGIRFELGYFAEWARASGDRVTAYLVTMLLALPLLLWLSWRSRRVLATDAHSAAAHRVLRRPVSAWLVLALVGLPFFMGDAPLVLHQIALVLAVIPVLRLLPARVFEVLGFWPYVATVLYVCHRLSFVLLDEPLYYRLYLLAIAVVTGIGLAWLLLGRRRQQATREGTPGRVVRMLTLIGWMAVAALVVAVVANVFGNVSLAEMLTGGVLDSTYVGLALYAGAHVLSSVLNLMLARRTDSQLNVVTQRAGPLLASASKLILFAAFVVWLVVTANMFRIARPVYGAVSSVLTFPLEVGQISITLGSILLFGVAIWLAFWVAKTVRLLLREDVLPRMALPRGVDNSVATLSYYAVIIVGLMVALAAAGFQASQFAIVFGALGVGIGFGLQNIVNNFVSGLILMFERPIQPGDVVEVSGTSGKVRDIGMRATTLTTFEGADVVVPNGTLLSEKLINWTLSDMNRRVDVEIGVGYGSDPRRVIALLREVASGTPGIVAEPEPAIVFKGFAANSLDFGIRAWTHDFGDWVSIRTEMTARVYEALQREGIQIPFPQQDLHLRSVSPQAAECLATVSAAARARTEATMPPSAPA